MTTKASWVTAGLKRSMSMSCSAPTRASRRRGPRRQRRRWRARIGARMDLLIDFIGRPGPRRGRSQPEREPAGREQRQGSLRRARAPPRRRRRRPGPHHLAGDPARPDRPSRSTPRPSTQRPVGAQRQVRAALDEPGEHGPHCPPTHTRSPHAAFDVQVSPGVGTHRWSGEQSSSASQSTSSVHDTGRMQSPSTQMPPPAQSASRVQPEGGTITSGTRSPSASPATHGAEMPMSRSPGPSAARRSPTGSTGSPRTTRRRLE